MPSWFMFATENTPLISMGSLDIVIIAIYFAVMLGIGIYLKKCVSTGEDVFMAGRKMTAWLAGLSLVSANLSSLETMEWSAVAYQNGMLGAHAYLMGAIPAILFLAIVMMPFYYICKTHSVPGYLKRRFGTSSSTLAGISLTILKVLVSGASMFAMAKILRLLLGWNMSLSIWLTSLTLAVYLTLEGFISAVFNEVLQHVRGFSISARVIPRCYITVDNRALCYAGKPRSMRSTRGTNWPDCVPGVIPGGSGTQWIRNGSGDRQPLSIIDNHSSLVVGKHVPSRGQQTY
jgi:Na+(H+)/acetate symporter ActP